jgi:acyl carrier protein
MRTPVAGDWVGASVLAIVTRIAGPHRAPPDPGLETALAEGGFWLESAGLLEVVIACEAEFRINFDPETDLSLDRLATIGSLTETIRARLGATP